VTVRPRMPWTDHDATPRAPITSQPRQPTLRTGAMSKDTGTSSLPARADTGEAPRGEGPKWLEIPSPIWPTHASTAGSYTSG